MKLLAIETSTESCSVALRVGDDVLERFALAPRGHAELLLPWVQELLAESGLALGALDALAFGQGPGSFTSLRIGIGVVQGLAWGADLPVAPVSSLQAAAQGVVVDGVEKAMVALDARMGEVFAGRYALETGVMRPRSPESVGPPEAQHAGASEGWHGVGNGFARYAALQALAPSLRGVIPDAWPGAAAILTLAADWLSSHAGLPAERAQPVYLRDNVAQKPADRQP